ncbi:related to 40S ribosomal protein S25 [Rhynchosporium agropyri]|uniref:40S ribosomal protein S25 n=3 Tax=Rhynchosporium TaxID=38037 RepID=A0A1E1KSW2_9HELO|nr:related to 40S ribosomal protein S25 [Rhynchosporium agropyri]
MGFDSEVTVDTRAVYGLAETHRVSAARRQQPPNVDISHQVNMAPANTGAKKQKKKWSKGKVKDKAQHAVILDKATSDKLYKDVQSYRLITVATLVDRLKINGSLARRCLTDLEEKGQIKKIVGHSKLQIYTRAVAAAE